jgi:hypothetical protein
MVRRLALLTILLIALGTVSAHLSGGKHISTDQYFLEIGHTPDPITAEETTTFLITAAYKNGTQARVDSVHVTIRRDTTLLAATMKANQAGSTSFNYAFPKPGTYNVTTTFNQDEKALVEHTTSLTAQPKPTTWYEPLWSLAT